MSISLLFTLNCFAESGPITKADSYQKNIPVKLLKKIPLPEGYHEGLFYDGSNIWVNNGEKGNTWVVDITSGEVISEIEPVGTFTEGLTKTPEGDYWLTDWDAKKVYHVEIIGNSMKPVFELSVAPAHPTGIVWNGNSLHLITWTRGMGTKYHLIQMDKEGKILRKNQIKGISEPSQLAWDGKNLWISSWYNQRVYRVDVSIFQITGYFRSPAKKTTGIVWDGEHLWVTGTKADLYMLKIEDHI